MCPSAWAHWNSTAGMLVLSDDFTGDRAQNFHKLSPNRSSLPMQKGRPSSGGLGTRRKSVFRLFGPAPFPRLQRRCRLPVLRILGNKIIASPKMLVELAGQLRRKWPEARPAAFQQKHRYQLALRSIGKRSKPP